MPRDNEPLDDDGLEDKRECDGSGNNGQPCAGRHCCRRLIATIDALRRWTMPPLLKNPLNPLSDVSGQDISFEAWREYQWSGRDDPYIIRNPRTLFRRPGGTTHRIVDSKGVAHCVPAPGERGCVLRWKSRDPERPVVF